MSKIYTDPVQEIVKAVTVLNDPEGSSFDDIYEYFKTKKPNTAPFSEPDQLRDLLGLAVSHEILLEVDGKYTVNIPNGKSDEYWKTCPHSIPKDVPESKNPEKNGKVTDTSISPERERALESTSDTEQAALQNLERTAEALPENSGNFTEDGTGKEA